MVGACWTWNFVMHNPLCTMMFRCGCREPWNGGWVDCNVHWAVPIEDKCPFCLSSAVYTEDTVIAAMLVTYVVLALLPRDRVRARKARFVLPFVVFWLVGWFVGLLFFLTSDYHTFFVRWRRVGQ